MPPPARAITLHVHGVELGHGDVAQGRYEVKPGNLGVAVERLGGQRVFNVHSASLLLPRTLCHGTKEKTACFWGGD